MVEILDRFHGGCQVPEFDLQVSLASGLLVDPGGATR